MKNKKLNLILIGLIVLFCAIELPSLGLATTYYVATNGNNSYNGLYPSYQSGSNGPWLTLGKAAGTVKAGDTVQIRGGIYVEKVYWGASGTETNRITVTNYPGETPIIDGQYTLPGGSYNNYLVQIQGNYVTFSNMIMKRSSGALFALAGHHNYAINIFGDGSNETGMCAGGHDNVFDGCIMTDNGKVAVPWGSAIATVGDHNIIQNCIVYENRGEGLNAYGNSSNSIIQDCIAYDNKAYNIYLDSSSGAIVRRNIVYQTKTAYMTTGIMVGCETGQPTNISVYNNFVVGCRVNFETYATVLSNLTVVYNTFVNSTGNASTGYNMGVYIRANTNTYSNCIFKNNIVIEEGAGRVPISVESSHPGLTFSNNCWNRTPTAAALGTGDVIADPKLAKTGSTAAGLLTPAWFKILENSPARDMATVLSNVTEDFFKTPRGSAPDMGGHEFSYGTSSLTASATDSPTAGQAPLTVNFKGSASGGTSPYSYRWTFGDGGSSTSQNPSHTYSSAGTYTATLTVTDSTSATNSKSLTITVTSAPSQLAANVLASPSSGQAPLTVNFTGSATGGVTPYSYRWTFGDGGSTTSQNPSHTYSSAGSYTATLTVTDSTSATNSKSLTITVTSAPSQLTATAYADPTSGLAPLSVNFTGSAAGGAPPYSYNWNFGDGGSSSVQNPSHTYSTIGNYSAILTVTDNNSANASATVIISVGSVTGANLALAAETGSPAPGQGGTTDPSPGNHSYPIGTTVSVKSVPNTDYRFSKWSGDIIDSSMFSSATTLTMDKSKSLSATFCTKCADVNGDLKITPADAQLAFDIYLGRVASPTWCELENADVNCSGTKLTPKVTPSDAQAIFHKFLRRKVASSDCSGSSRAATLSMQSAGFTNVNLTINSVTFAPGQDILIPVIIESPSEIKAFGFDLSFPSSVMTYIGLERTVLTNDYDQLDANVIAYPATNQGENKTEPTEAHLSGFDSILASKIFMPQALDSREPLQDVDQPIVNKTNYRVLRVGGYKTSLSENPSSGVLVTLIFRVTGEVKDPSPLSVMATYDDIQNASIRNGMVNSQDNAQVRQEKRPVGNIERKFSGKRYDF